MQHIVILTHEFSSVFEEAPYHMRYISELWRQDGFRVTILRGTDTFIDADIAVMHVDTTKTSKEYIEFINRYPRTINARVTNISKRHISENLVKRQDGYHGAVVVKTNLNYGGEVDAKIARQTSLPLKLEKAIRRRLPWSMRSELKGDEYLVFDNQSKVPSPVWLNSDLVVEKFLPEKVGDEFMLRTWVFLGDKETHSIMYSKDPVIKSANVSRRSSGTSVPDELRQIRKDLDFDYGKFDYVISNGKPVLYDANRSPARGVTPGDPFMDRMRILADGLHVFLKE